MRNQIIAGILGILVAIPFLALLGWYFGKKMAEEMFRFHREMDRYRNDPFSHKF